MRALKAQVASGAVSGRSASARCLSIVTAAVPVFRFFQRRPGFPELGERRGPSAVALLAFKSQTRSGTRFCSKPQANFKGVLSSVQVKPQA